MTLTEAMQIVADLIKYRNNVVFEADGADDRVYPSEQQWEAIEKILNACIGEF